MTNSEAKKAVQIMRAALRARFGFHLDDDAPSHKAALLAIREKLCGRVPRDECPCGGLLRLDGLCRDCGERKS